MDRYFRPDTLALGKRGKYSTVGRSQGNRAVLLAIHGKFTCADQGYYCELKSINRGHFK